MKLSLLALVAAVLVVPGAMAGTPAVQPLELGAIVSQQAQIREQVLAGEGRYKDMSQKTRDELLEKQAALLKMIGGRGDPADLSQEQRLQALNTLEWIEAAVNSEEDQRMVCARERRTGSMRITKVCKTQRQIDEDRDPAHRQMEGNMPIDV
jgi:hypothetical protein